jgi:glyoxylase-like metal-dependent hydrolase (beta-lactamase superfamily II)
VLIRVLIRVLKFVSRNHCQITIVVAGTSLQATVTLVKLDGAVLLIDSGWPRTRTKLIDGLAQQGVRTEDVTHILHTHLHIDHATNHSVFSRAVLLVSEAEFHWADDFYRALVEESDDRRFLSRASPDLPPERIDAAISWINVAREICRKELFQRWDQFRFYEENDLPAGVTVVPLFGHTPGHCGISIENTGRILVAGDALPHAGASPTEMPASDPSLFEKSARCVQDFEGLIIPGHFPPFRNKKFTTKAQRTQKT